MNITHRHTRSALKALAAVALTVAVAVFPSLAKGRRNAPRQKWATEADARKADYYFMEALRQNTLDKDDAFFDLLSTAWQLDSTDTASGQTLGYYMMALGQNDSLYATKGYNMIRRHFDAHPDDYYGAIFYGMINDRLGNVQESVRVWQTLDSLKPDNPDVAIRYAQALMAGDSAQIRRSITVADRIQRTEGVDLGLTSHKVRAFMALNDTADALAELDAFRKASPSSAEFYIYAGDVYDAYRMADRALESYNEACRVDSTNGLAFYKRAEFYKERGDSADYDREVFHALQMESLDIEPKLEMLTSYIRELYTDSLQLPRIEHLFEVLLEQQPHEPRIRDLYTSYFIAVNNPKAAAEQQEATTDTDPADKKRWLRTMSLYYQTKDYEKSAEIGRRGLGYFPGDADITLLLAGDLQAQEKWQEVIPMVKSVLDTLPAGDNEQRSQAFQLIGDSFHQLGMPDSAFFYYDKALEEYPDNLMAANNYAYYLTLGNGDLNRAEHLASMAVRSQPDNDTYLDTYAWVFFKKHDYKRAKEYIDQAVDLEGDEPSAEVLHHAGDIYYFNGLPDEALDFWQRALKLEPDNLLLKKKVRNKTHYFE